MHIHHCVKHVSSFFVYASILGNPIHFTVHDLPEVRVSGQDIELVECHKPATFTVHTNREEAKHLRVAITGARSLIPEPQNV